MTVTVTQGARRPGRDEPQDGTRNLRAAFIMEQDVGHVVQAIHLRRELAQIQDLDWSYIPVSFWSPDGLVERLKFLPATVRASYRARREVLAGLHGAEPDALFWNTQKPAAFATRLLETIPSVVSLDVTPKQYDELGEEYGHRPDRLPVLSGMKERLNRRIFSLARRLLPATEWVARSLVDDYGVSRERIEVLAPGTELQRFQPTARLANPECPVKVLFVGGDFRRKGGDIVLDWFRHAPAGVHLDIVTRDDVPPDTRAQIHRLNYEDPAMVRLYQQADIFVLPTRAECFGLVLTEAMACGVPCVTSPVGGLAEVVEEGVSGLHVPPGDLRAFGAAMTTLLEDPALRTRLGRGGRLAAEQRFDARKNVRRIVEVLSEVAGEGRS